MAARATRLVEGYMDENEAQRLLADPADLAAGAVSVLMWAMVTVLALQWM